MGDYVRFKAGPGILDIIREEGLNPERVRVFAAPAGGPKWFISVGFDRGLIQSRFLWGSTRRVLLAGSSAGGWRCLTMMCKDPLEAHEKLRIAYSRNVFTAADTPRTISQALARNVDAFLGDEDIPFILEHPAFDLALHTVRSRGPAGSENRAVQGTALIGAALMNVISPRAMDLAFERAVFYTPGQVSGFLTSGFRGNAISLTSNNLRMAALATGSLPYIVAGVTGIPDAPRGVYRDGGVLDYQLNEDYCPGTDGITLFLHYQERIVPGWFDKSLWWRAPAGRCLDRVLQVYPGPRCIESLPDGRIPDRDDFRIFVDNPAERFRRWDAVSEMSSVLWEEFIEAVDSKAIRNLVQPL